MAVVVAKVAITDVVAVRAKIHEDVVALVHTSPDHPENMSVPVAFAVRETIVPVVVDRVQRALTEPDESQLILLSTLVTVSEAFPPVTFKLKVTICGVLVEVITGATQ